MYGLYFRLEIRVVDSGLAVEGKQEIQGGCPPPPSVLPPPPGAGAAGTQLDVSVVPQLGNIEPISPVEETPSKPQVREQRKVL